MSHVLKFHYPKIGENADGSREGAQPPILLAKAIEESENPLHRVDGFYAEHFSEEACPIPDLVQEELDGCILATPDFGVDLRAPNMSVRGMKEAVTSVGQTMPVHYGEPAGECS